MKTRKAAMPRMPSSHAVGWRGFGGCEGGWMVVWIKVGRRKKEVRFMACVMADLEGIDMFLRDVCLPVARMPVLLSSDGSPFDMSRWPSDMIASQVVTLRSIE